MYANQPSHRQVLFVATLSLSLTLVSVFPQTSFAQTGSISFSLVPVNASGMHTIMGNRIILPQGGQQVIFELKYSNWTPIALKGFQFQIDPSSYNNGNGNPLRFTTLACTQDADCEAVFGAGADCVLEGDLPNLTGTNVCRSVFYTPGREDDIPEENGGDWGLHGIATFAVLDCGKAADADPNKTDPGFDVYACTMILEVPSGASGRYVIDYIRNPKSFAIDSNNQLVDIVFQPAIVELPGGCCLPDGGCQNGMTSTMCNAVGGTPTTRPCTSDCNRNDINDTCEILSGAAEDCNDNNKIDSCEIFNNRALDCNFSFRLDECDLADGTSIDCNANNLPDECDIAQNRMVNDCNQNGVLDSCELQFGVMMVQDCNNNNIIDDCELIINSGSDCDGNGILDECDLADGTTVDIDGNCVPDVCDPSIAPMAEPNGQLKSRYISFISTNAGCNTAIRVKLVSLYHPDPPVPTKDFTAFEGEYRWIGPPTTYPEDVELAGFIFTGAQLQCTPHFADWSTVGLVHAFGSEVVPDSIYEIQMVDSTCPDLNDPSCYSAILEVRTGRWGDVIEPFAHNSNTQQPTIADILIIVDKHLGTLLPIKARTQMIPNVPMPNFRVSVAADAIAVVDAWLGGFYPFDGPTSCSP